MPPESGTCWEHTKGVAPLDRALRQEGWMAGFVGQLAILAALWATALAVAGDPISAIGGHADHVDRSADAVRRQVRLVLDAEIEHGDRIGK